MAPANRLYQESYYRSQQYTQLREMDRGPPFSVEYVNDPADTLDSFFREALVNGTYFGAGTFCHFFHRLECSHQSDREPTPSNSEIKVPYRRVFRVISMPRNESLPTELDDLFLSHGYSLIEPRLAARLRRKPFMPLAEVLS